MNFKNLEEGKVGKSEIKFSKSELSKLLGVFKLEIENDEKKKEVELFLTTYFKMGGEEPCLLMKMLNNKISFDETFWISELKIMALKTFLKKKEWVKKKNRIREEYENSFKDKTFESICYYEYTLGLLLFVYAETYRLPLFLRKIAACGILCISISTVGRVDEKINKLKNRNGD